MVVEANGDDARPGIDQPQPQPAARVDRNLRARNIGWRLDYVLASESLAERATSCPSFREIGTSDHAPVVATFE